MAVVEYVQDAQASDAAASSLELVRRNRGGVSEFARILAHQPAVLEAFEAFSAAQRQWPVEPRYRELMILRIAILCENEYEWRRHVPAAEGCGVTRDQMRDLSTWRESSAFDPLDRLLLDMVDQQAFAGRVSRATMGQLRDQLGDAGVVSVCVTMGWYLLIAAVMTSLRVDEDDTHAQAEVTRPPRTDRPLSSPESREVVSNG